MVNQQQAKRMTAFSCYKNFNKEIENASRCLLSQWNGRFLGLFPGLLFGGIRAIQGMSKALTQLESDMTVIAWTR